MIPRVYLARAKCMECRATIILAYTKNGVEIFKQECNCNDPKLGITRKEISYPEWLYAIDKAERVK